MKENALNSKKMGIIESNFYTDFIENPKSKDIKKMVQAYTKVIVKDDSDFPV